MCFDQTYQNYEFELIFRSNNGGEVPHPPIKSSPIDKQFLTAPIKSAVDKFQLLPEFLKVCQPEIYFFIYLESILCCCHFFIGVVEWHRRSGDWLNNTWIPLITLSILK